MSEPEEEPKVFIVSQITVTLTTAIPWNQTYFPDTRNPQDAVDFEQNRSVNEKLEYLCNEIAFATIDGEEDNDGRSRVSISDVVKAITIPNDIEGSIAQRKMAIGIMLFITDEQK